LIIIFKSLSINFIVKKKKKIVVKNLLFYYYFLFRKFSFTEKGNLVRVIRCRCGGLGRIWKFYIFIFRSISYQLSLFCKFEFGGIFENVDKRQALSWFPGLQTEYKFPYLKLSYCQICGTKVGLSSKTASDRQFFIQDQTWW